VYTLCTQLIIWVLISSLAPLDRQICFANISAASNDLHACRINQINPKRIITELETVLFRVQNTHQLVNRSLVRGCVPLGHHKCQNMESICICVLPYISVVTVYELDTTTFDSCPAILWPLPRVWFRWDTVLLQQDYRRSHVVLAASVNL